MWKNAKLHLLISCNLILYDNKALKLHVIRIKFTVIFHGKGNLFRIIE